MNTSSTLSLPAGKEFYTIGEISRLTGVKPTVLRYWERSFRLLRPARRGSGHRRFTRQDVETIGRLRELIYDRRLTLEGARKQLREDGKKKPLQVSLAFEESSAAIDFLRDVKKELADLLVLLKDRPLPPAL